VSRNHHAAADNETAFGAIGLSSAAVGPPPQYSDLDLSYRELAPSLRRLVDDYMLANARDSVAIDGTA